MKPPAEISKYGPKGFSTRTRLYIGLSLEQWLAILSDRSTPFYWTVPWWDLAHVVDARGTGYVRVASLSFITFYLPGRVRRQYGRIQGDECVSPPRTTRRVLDDKVIKDWEKSWVGYPRVRISPLPMAPQRSSSMSAGSSSGLSSVHKRLGKRHTVWDRLKGLVKSKKSRDERY